MLLFADGFDHYAAADLTKKGWTLFNAPIIGSAAGRRGGGALQAPFNSASASSVVRSMSAMVSWVIGFSFKVTAFPTNATIVRLLDAGVTQCELKLNSDGTLSVTRNGTVLTGGTSTFAITPNTDYYIEWKVTIADSIAANSCKVRINGVTDWITVATGQDTKNTANASANQISVGASGSVVLATYTFDDFYICDQSGTTNNDFLGDIRVDTLYPNADGTYSQWTPSTGTNHSALVDEATPNTTDYNYALTPGLRDSYAFQDLPSLVSSTVYGVQANAAMLKDDAGNKQVAPFVRSGGADTDGATAALGTSQAYVSQIFETNGGAAWTQASVNSMEAGVKVVV